MRKRLGIFVTHPVQYHVPIWRALAASSDLDVTVHYFSDMSVRGGIDPGFGVPVAWDTPMLEGYKSRFISRDADVTKCNRLRIPDIVNLLDEEKFDFILINGYTCAFERQIVRYAKKKSTKVILRGEFTDSPRPGRSVIKKYLREIYLKWFYSGVDKFCYVGVEAKNHLQKIGIPSNKMFFSPYSVDNGFFETQKQQLNRVECRAQLGLGNNDFTFLCSGKLIPRKMPLLLAEAVLSLPENNKIALIFVGDGPQKSNIETSLRPVLKNRLILPGFVNQSGLGKYFIASDAFILPSNFETWGLVVNEAMIFSLPVIVSDAVGCRKDLVIPQKTGFIFQSGNVDSLANSMREMLARPEMAKILGNNAYKKIKEYSVSESVQGILDAIR